MFKPELLAPVGSMEALRLAVSNGADAVYFAGAKFGARTQVASFSNDDIIEIINFAHRHNVKAYITINTLIKDSEFSEVISFIDFLITANIDAFIIQDLGLLYYLSQTYPAATIHASTQMNVLTIAKAKELYDLGVKRIIFARETPLDLICDIIKTIPIETEVFVHGALCLSYSGGCYFSSIIGRNSGNRGKCRQPCRQPYRLEYFEDEEYYLSTKDLMTLDNITELIKCQITSLKIEGRTKRSEYVGTVVRAYRKTLDGFINNNYHEELSKMFNREFTKGFLFGAYNHDITNTLSPNHIGVDVGRVIRYHKLFITVLLEKDINAGDALRIASKDEDAIIVNEIIYQNKSLKAATAGMIVSLRVHKEAEVNARVLKTSDALLIEDIKKSQVKQIPLTLTLDIVDEKLVLNVSDGLYHVCLTSENHVIYAEKEEAFERLITQLSKTGNDEYYFEKIEANIKPIFMPIKEINELRRKALKLIDEVRLERQEKVKYSFSKENLNILKTHKLIFKVRTFAQLQTCLNLKVENIFVENKNWLKYANEDTSITYVNPRLKAHMSDEYSNIYNNVTNIYSVYALHQAGAKLIGLSLELSLDEIKELISEYKKQFNHEANLMLMVYGHYHLMINKHCLINKAYKKDKLYCGACYEKLHHLIDRHNNRYPLMDDGDCNLIVLNNKVLNLISYMSELFAIGLSNYLVEFTIEEDIEDIVIAYQKAFNNEEITFEMENESWGHIKEGVL